MPTARSVSSAKSSTERRRSPRYPAFESDLAWMDASFHAQLGALVEKLRADGRADGAAIAICEADEIVCRASSGSAPAVGMRISPAEGLSGECVRTGRLIGCKDTARDARVDPEVCRSLNLGSVAIAPVLRDGKAIGLVECLWAQAEAFGEGEIGLLQATAEAIAGLLPAAPMAPETELPAKAPDEAPDKAPERLMGKAPDKAIEVVESTLSPEKAPGNDRGQAQPAMAGPAPALPGSAPVSPDIQTPAFLASPNWVELDSPALARPSFLGLRARLVFVVVLLALVLTAALGWRALRPRASSSATLGEKQPPPLPAPTAKAVEPPTQPVRRQDPSALQDSSSDSTSDGAAPDEPEPASSPIRIRTQTPSEAAAMTPPELLLKGQEPKDIAALIAPARTPGTNLPAAAVAPPAIVPPKLLKKVLPVYPATARSLRREGSVFVEVIVGTNGKVLSAKPRSGDPLLAPAAVSAISQWKYHPATREGVPVEATATVSVDFKLSQP